MASAYMLMRDTHDRNGQLSRLHYVIAKLADPHRKLELLTRKLLDD
jgi:hypothetical protein